MVESKKPNPEPERKNVQTKPKGTLKRPKRTEQTQIRQLLKKQSDQGLHCFLFSQGDFVIL